MLMYLIMDKYIEGTWRRGDINEPFVLNRFKW